MSTPINDGGPAFPHQPAVNANGEYILYGDCGMSLRDYFAGQCDPSIYSPLDTLQTKLDRKATLQELAVYIANIRLLEADAMIEVRKTKLTSK